MGMQTTLTDHIKPVFETKEKQIVNKSMNRQCKLSFKKEVLRLKETLRYVNVLMRNVGRDIDQDPRTCRDIDFLTNEVRILNLKLEEIIDEQ